jgi:hypothetical protein
MIGSGINNWYKQALQEDPGCCASKKATRVQDERYTHRVSSPEFKEKYRFDVDTMDIEGLACRVYEWIASVPTLRLEQAYQFDIRNLFVVEPHTDVVVGPPGDQQPWMNDTDDSQLLMFFQTYGKNEGINVTRGQYTYHRDPVPIKDIRNADGSMLLPIATAFIMLLKAHEHSVATNCDPTPPSSALFKKILRDSKDEPRTVRECYPNMTNDWHASKAQVVKPPFAKEQMPKKQFLLLRL